MQTIFIAGGDLRQVRLAEMLKEKGCAVHAIGFGKLGVRDDWADKPDWVFLPVPYRVPGGALKAPYSETELRLTEIVERYPGCAVLLGGTDARAREALAGRRTFDVLADEAFIVANAMLTAQGAVCAYLKGSEEALCGARCVVTGFGRITKLLAPLLAAHAARVTIVARRHSDLEFARAMGHGAVHISGLAQALRGADVVFNTVPERIFGEEELRNIPARACVIELASPPYGLDVERAKEMGLDARIEAGLPGRYFPASAAAAMLRAFEREEAQHGTGR